MQESTLYRISLCSGLLGILALALISSMIELDEKDISRITSQDVDTTIKIKGIVEKITENNDNIYLSVKHDSTLEVVLFGGDKIFSNGDEVVVTGKLQEYKGRVSMIGDEIELVG
tara:strand:- start:6433 stop:6777 length:345 start_codon:yes stop_codon:yes gene_type:complete